MNSWLLVRMGRFFFKKNIKYIIIYNIIINNNKILKILKLKKNYKFKFNNIYLLFI